MESTKKDILWRIYLLYFLTALFGLFIFFKVLYIQVIEGDKWRSVARTTTMRYFDIDAIRGDICADDGRLLATSIPVYEIRMDLSPAVISDELFYNKIDSLAIKLSMLFNDRSREDYKSSIIEARRRGERYFLVKRNVSYHEMNALREFPIFNLGRFRGGLIIVENKRREMPFKNLASRTIGYERGGVFVGLEGAYREKLQGVHGKRLMQRTSGGLWMPVSSQNEIEPINGKDVITTININIQDIVENSLRSKLEKSEASHGTAVVMEVATGKIKAISNLTRTEGGSYIESFNYAIGESTEPGSTFKLASMIAVLEDSKFSPEDLINTGDGEIAYSDRVMRDAVRGGFGTITVQNAFEVSSNVAISKIVHDSYSNNPMRFVNRLRSLGLDKPLNVEIRGEAAPVISDVTSSSWSAVSLPWMAIGYEVSLTPLQLLTFYNGIANNGKVMKPMFVNEIRQTGKTVKKYSPTVINEKLCSPETIRKVKAMLEGVVKNGTASNIYTSKYSIAGKTGTAQVADTKHGYRRESGVVYRASFAGYFPADNPVYSMIVVVHDPQGYAYNGSLIAAPVFREIADRIFATQLDFPNHELYRSKLAWLPSFRMGNFNDMKKFYSNFDCVLTDLPNNQWVQSVVNSDTVKFREREFVENLVPSVIGMGLKDAIYMLENVGMNVKFEGKGMVRKQSIRPGVRIRKGDEIFLELS